MNQMNVVITGGAGFLGSMLTSSLINNYSSQISSITVVDITPMIDSTVKDSRVNNVVANIADKEHLSTIITSETTHVFHLAAIVSSHAEKDFDLGVSVNFDATRLLLERCREVNKDIRFVFSSSLAVFGGNLPSQITPMVATQPINSYGTQKSMCELLINDYTRKDFVDGISVRLPTICIRPGVANKAASSFVSGIIREPLKGEKSNCPITEDLPIWISSPETVIENIIHAGNLSLNDDASFRALNLPGIKVTTKEMLIALKNDVGEASLQLVTHNFDPNIEKFMSNLPQSFDNEKEISLGFKVDIDFKSILVSYIKQYHPRT